LFLSASASAAEAMSLRSELSRVCLVFMHRFYENL
jgi:hypothetical protein